MDLENGNMKIDKALKRDAQALTELTIRSKSHWDYSSEQIENWRDDLEVSETYILEKQVYKLTINKVLIGYFSYFELNDGEVKLENLFIEPQFIGKGFGKILMIDFFEKLENTKYKRVVLEADPNVEKFYSRFGFEVFGQLETSIKNRYLPMMSKDINT